MAECGLSQPLDILSSKENQLSILVPYLEALAKGDDSPLPVTPRSIVLVARYLWGWKGLYTLEESKKATLTPEGAFLYYLKLEEKK